MTGPLTEALEACKEYLEGRADAELDSSGYTGNEEMRLLMQVQEAMTGARRVDETLARCRYFQRELTRCRDILAQARGMLEIIKPGTPLHYCPTVERVRTEAKTFQETSRLYPKAADLEAYNAY